MDIDELNDRLSALKSIIWDGVEEIKRSHHEVGPVEVDEAHTAVVDRRKTRSPRWVVPDEKTTPSSLECTPLHGRKKKKSGPAVRFSKLRSILKRIVKYLIESRIDRKYIDVSFVREAFHSVDAGRTGRVDRDTFFTVVREILHWNIETKPLDDICKLTCVASENVIDYTTFQAAFATLKCVPSTPKVAALSRASMAAREAKWSSSSPSSSSASPPLTKTTMTKRLTSEKEFE